MATTSMSSPKFCTAARSTLRPMRPNPLMPTLIAMGTSTPATAPRRWIDGWVERTLILAVVRRGIRRRGYNHGHEDPAACRPAVRDRRPRPRLGPARPPAGRAPRGVRAHARRAGPGRNAAGRRGRPGKPLAGRDLHLGRRTARL